MSLREILPLCRSWREEFRRNYKLLEEELSATVPEFESISYGDLKQRMFGGTGGVTRVERVVEGKTLSVELALVEEGRDGGLLFAVDAKGLPTMFGGKPSWQFRKHPDGSISHPSWQQRGQDPPP